MKKILYIGLLLIATMTACKKHYCLATIENYGDDVIISDKYGTYTIRKKESIKAIGTGKTYVFTTLYDSVTRYAPCVDGYTNIIFLGYDEQTGERIIRYSDKKN